MLLATLCILVLSSYTQLIDFASASTMTCPAKHSTLKERSLPPSLRPAKLKRANHYFSGHITQPLNHENNAAGTWNQQFHGSNEHYKSGL